MHIKIYRRALGQPFSSIGLFNCYSHFASAYHSIQHEAMGQQHEPLALL